MERRFMGSLFVPLYTEFLGEYEMIFVAERN